MWGKIRKTVSHCHSAWKIAKIASADEGITIGDVFDNAIFEKYGRP